MSPVWPRSKIAWTGVPHRFRNDFDLSAVKGDGRPQDSKCFADGLDKLRRARALAASVRGPSDWESVIRKHREVLNISLDPPETKRILLKTKNFVNASLLKSLKLSGKDLQLVARRSFVNKKELIQEPYKNPLALRKSCDIFAPVCVSPLF